MSKICGHTNWCACTKFMPKTTLTKAEEEQEKVSERNFLRPINPDPLSRMGNAFRKLKGKN